MDGWMGGRSHDGWSEPNVCTTKGAKLQRTQVDTLPPLLLLLLLLNSPDVSSFSSPLAKCLLTMLLSPLKHSTGTLNTPPRPAVTFEAPLKTKDEKQPAHRDRPFLQHGSYSTSRLTNHHKRHQHHHHHHQKRTRGDPPLPAPGQKKCSEVGGGAGAVGRIDYLTAAEVVPVLLGPFTLLLPPTPPT